MHTPITPMRRVTDLVVRERHDLGTTVAYSVAIGLLALAVPVGVQSLVNTVAFGTVLQPIVVLTLLVAAALVAAAVLQVMRAITVEIVQRRIFVRLAGQVADTLLRARTDAFDAQHGPDLVNRFLEVVTVQKSFSILIIDGLSLLMQTVIGLALLGVYHPYLLAFDAIVVLSMAIILGVLGRGGEQTAIAESRAKYDVLGFLEEIALHPSAFRDRASVAFALARVNEMTDGYLSARASHFRVLMRQIGASLMLQAVAMAALLGVGGALVLRGELTLGQLIAAEVVVAMLVGGFAKLGKSLETFYDLLAAMDKLGHLTDLPTEDVRGETLAPAATPAHLRMRGVAFTRGTGRTLFRHLEIEVERGEKVAIHALGGLGKSTLLDLLYGLRDANDGSIAIDGHDYRDIRQHDLRERIALVRGVDIVLGTVADNVRLGRPAELHNVRDALARAGVLDAVLALPNGLQTSLTTGGAPLSPSQALRVVFARAFLARPSLLLVDEALEHIDDITVDGQLIRTLFAPDAPWTLIIATEDPAMWPLCDRVFHLSEGTLLEDTGETRPRRYVQALS